jgi:hypothetical protein
MRVDPGWREELWEGAVAWTSEGEAWQPWRLHPDAEGLAYAPELFARARMAAGVRLRLRTDARAITVELELEGDAPGSVDLVVDGLMTERTSIPPGRTLLEAVLPARAADVELWLPQHGCTRVRTAELSDAHEAVAVGPTGPRWVAYGSSITRCATSRGPSETWPALVARDLGLDLLCMGFGGQCHLDPVVPGQIGRARPDVITACLGINVYGALTFGPRSWPGQVAGFIARLRAECPHAVIVVLSPIGCPAREDTPNATGLTLAALRDDVERVAGDLRERGDERLFLVSGIELLSPEEGELLVDGLHPGPEGYHLMAERLVPRLSTALPSAK